MKKVLILTVLMAAFTINVQSQNEEKVQKHNIVSRTVWDYDISGRRENVTKESFKRFDERGNEIEVIEYNKSGEVTFHESYQFNARNQKTVEIKYDEDGKIEKKFEYKYSGDLKIERIDYDDKGNIIGRKKYVYEFR